MKKRNWYKIPSLHSWEIDSSSNNEIEDVYFQIFHFNLLLIYESQIWFDNLIISNLLKKIARDDFKLKVH